MKCPYNALSWGHKNYGDNSGCPNVGVATRDFFIETKSADPINTNQGDSSIGVNDIVTPIFFRIKYHWTYFSIVLDS